MEKTTSKPIALAADHGGVGYKDKIAGLLRDLGYEVADYGTHSTEACDYPDVAHAAAEAVSRGDSDLGIIVCGSGMGIAMVANKSKGVRAANCLTVKMARLCRDHNHANVLSLGERLMDWETAEQIVRTFLATPPSQAERHLRRVRKIHELTNC